MGRSRMRLKREIAIVLGLFLMIASSLYFDLGFVKLEGRRNIMNVDRVKEAEEAPNTTTGVLVAAAAKQHSATKTTPKKQTCARKCLHYNNRVALLTKNHKAGLNDRKCVITNLAKLASFLCAKLVVPPPFYMLIAAHNGGKKVDRSLSWEHDFFQVHRIASSEEERRGGRRGTRSDDGSVVTALLDESQSSWFDARISNGKVDSLFEKNASNWVKRHTTRDTNIQDDFDFVHNYTSYQQLNQQHADAYQPFLWTLRGPTYNYLGELYQSANRLRNSTGQAEAEAQGGYQWDLVLPTDSCYGVQVQSSRHVQKTARQVVRQIIHNKTGGGSCPHYGYLHLRRGDSSGACDTSLETMKQYLASTFNDQVLNKLGRGFPIFISSDDTDQEYRNEIKKLVQANGQLRFVDLDQVVTQVLQNQVKTNQIPEYKMSNYLVFLVLTEVSNGATFKLARRRDIFCNPHDQKIVQDALADWEENRNDDDNKRILCPP